MCVATFSIMRPMLEPCPMVNVKRPSRPSLAWSGEPAHDPPVGQAQQERGQRDVDPGFHELESPEAVRWLIIGRHPVAAASGCLTAVHRVQVEVDDTSGSVHHVLVADEST